MSDETVAGGRHRSWTSWAVLSWQRQTVRERISTLAIPLVLFALFITLSFASDVFLSQRNLLNIADQWAPTAIVACGATIVIIGGSFDLSTGAVFALAGVVAVKTANATSPAVGLVAGLVVGILVGTVNGLICTVGRVNSFIGTLATSIILRGWALAITGGFVIAATNKSFLTLGRQTYLSAKLSVFVLLIVFIGCTLLLRVTAFGRQLFAVGGNTEAARLSGVRVNTIRLTSFVIGGALAAVGGLLVASRAGSGQAGSAQGIEFTAIAAVVIGGNSIFGGTGAIWRTMVGVYLLALIGNGLDLLRVDPTYQQMIQGAIILAAVAIDALTREQSG